MAGGLSGRRTEAGAPRLGPGPVLVLGRAGIDLYADPPGTPIEEAAAFVPALGGSSANIAAALVRQGVPAGLLSRVSDDAAGDLVLAALDRHGIDRAHVGRAGGLARTSLALAETRGDATRAVIWRNGAADLALDLADVEAVRWDAWAALVATGTALSGEPSRAATLRALALARAAGRPAILDLDWRPTAWASAAEAAERIAGAARLCDAVVGNDEEFALLAGGGDGLAAARDLAAGGALVVHKMGARGAVAFAGGATIRTGVYPARPLKPTGAGDAFLGGLLAGLAAGEAPEAALRRGAAAAALVVGRVGCAPAMPTAAEVEALLAQAPSPGPLPA